MSIEIYDSRDVHDLSFQHLSLVRFIVLRSRTGHIVTPVCPKVPGRYVQQYSFRMSSECLRLSCTARVLKTGQDDKDVSV